MVKKYVFVRMPEEIYNLYRNVNQQQNNDLLKLGVQNRSIPMNFTFKSVVDPKINENFIEIDLKKLMNNTKPKRK